MKNRVIYLLLTTLLFVGCNEPAKGDHPPLVPLQGPEVAPNTTPVLPALEVHPQTGVQESHRDTSPDGDAGLPPILGNIHIATTSLNEGVVGAAYHETLFGEGGSGHCQWTASSLPPGLSLIDADRCTAGIDGTPDELGEFSVTVHVCDTDKGICDERVYEIKIGDNPVITVYKVSIGDDGEYTSVTRLESPTSSPLELTYGKETLAFTVTSREGDAGYTWTTNQEQLQLRQDIRVDGATQMAPTLFPYGRLEGHVFLSVVDRPLFNVTVRAESSRGHAEIQFSSLEFISDPCSRSPRVEVVMSTIENLSSGSVTMEMGKQVYAKFRAVGGIGPYKWVFRHHAQQDPREPDCSSPMASGDFCIQGPIHNPTWTTQEHEDGTLEVMGRLVYNGFLPDVPQEILTVGVVDSCPQTSSLNRYVVNLQRPLDTVADISVKMRVIDITDAREGGSLLRVRFYRKGKEIAWTGYDLAKCADDKSECENEKHVVYERTCVPGECAWEVPLTEIDGVRIYFKDKLVRSTTNQCKWVGRLDFDILDMHFYTGYRYAYYNDERDAENRFDNNVLSPDDEYETIDEHCSRNGRYPYEDPYREEWGERDITQDMSGYPALLWRLQRRQDN